MAEPSLRCAAPSPSRSPDAATPNRQSRAAPMAVATSAASKAARSIIAPGKCSLMCGIVVARRTSSSRRWAGAGWTDRRALVPVEHAARSSPARTRRTAPATRPAACDRSPGPARRPSPRPPPPRRPPGRGRRPARRCRSRALMRRSRSRRGCRACRRSSSSSRRAAARRAADRLRATATAPSAGKAMPSSPAITA